MKNKNAYTLIELLIGIALGISLFSTFLSAFFTAQEKTREKHRTEQRGSTFQFQNTIGIGDTVYIDGMDITGKVNHITFEGNVDLLIKNTNGSITHVELNGALLKKVIYAEN